MSNMGGDKSDAEKEAAKVALVEKIAAQQAAALRGGRSRSIVDGLQQDMFGARTRADAAGSDAAPAPEVKIAPAPPPQPASKRVVTKLGVSTKQTLSFRYEELKDKKVPFQVEEPPTDQGTKSTDKPRRPSIS